MSGELKNTTSPYLHTVALIQEQSLMEGTGSKGALVEKPPSSCAWKLSGGGKKGGAEGDLAPIGRKGAKRWRVLLKVRFSRLLSNTKGCKGLLRGVNGRPGLGRVFESARAAVQRKQGGGGADICDTCCSRWGGRGEKGVLFYGPKKILTAHAKLVSVAGKKGTGAAASYLHAH